MKRYAITLAAAFLTLASAGCAHLAATADPGNVPLTVSMPLSLAGVKDARTAFASLFADELAKQAPATEQNVSDWLNPAPTQSEARSPTLTKSATFIPHAGRTSVLIVPGMFGDCIDDQSVPFGDGVLRSRERSATEAYAQYADLGFHTIRLLPVAGRKSSTDNGRTLVAMIRAEAAKPDVEQIVLVAYSKGVPDTLEALTLLSLAGDIPGKVKALVAVAGPIMGTPVADRFEAIYATLSPQLNPFSCSPSDGLDIASVTRHERVARMQTFQPIKGVRTYTIVAYAPPELMAPPLRLTYSQLAWIDPRNDGQILAGDAILPGSTLLAAARADHWDVALPRTLHPNPLMRSLTSGRSFPRAALFRATTRWVMREID